MITNWLKKSTGKEPPLTLKTNAQHSTPPLALDDYRLTARRVELPSFEGNDPRGRIFRAEMHFHVQATPAEMKFPLA